MTEGGSNGTDLPCARGWIERGICVRRRNTTTSVWSRRCRAQADMIREKITASKLGAQPTRRKPRWRRARATLERTKKQLENAKEQKIRLEPGREPFAHREFVMIQRTVILPLALGLFLGLPSCADCPNRVN